MEMQKDLHSLKLLYSILQSTSIHMDDGARILFKNLLDSARDKIIATGRSMSISNSFNAIHSNVVHMHNSPKLEEQTSFRKKRCRVCQQSKIKDESSASEFSKQVSDSIRLIESAILSLQFSSDVSNPIKFRSLEEGADVASTTNRLENTPSFIVPGRTNESPAYHYVNGLRIPSVRDNDATRTADPSHKISRNDSLAQPDRNIGMLATRRPPIQSQLDCHGLGIPSIRDNDGTHTADPSYRTFRNDSLTQPGRNIGMLAKRRPSIQSRLDCASTAYSRNQSLMKPMLLDYESFAKKPYVKQQQRMTTLYQQESDVSSSSLQGSDVQSVVSSPSSSYTSTSQPQTETSDTAPGTSPDESTSNSSVNSSESYRSTGGKSRKMQRKNPDKAIRRLKRLKNKLQLIFHHHHHHHHHHNHGESETTKAKDHRSSMWKHLGMIFQHKDKERMYEKQAVRKLKTMPVSKKQVGQFQALVKGMARHVKQSKKSKVAKGRIRTQRNNKHWWQLFHGGRGRGVKLPNRGGRIRLHVKGKKPLLRAPKIIK